MSDVPDIVPGDADPQSQPPAGHLEGDSAPVGSASSPSRAAPEDTARTPAETPSQVVVIGIALGRMVDRTLTV